MTNRRGRGASRETTREARGLIWSSETDDGAQSVAPDPISDVGSQSDTSFVLDGRDTDNITHALGAEETMPTQLRPVQGSVSHWRIINVLNTMSRHSVTSIPNITRMCGEPFAITADELLGTYAYEDSHPREIQEDGFVKFVTLPAKFVARAGIYTSYYDDRDELNVFIRDRCMTQINFIQTDVILHGKDGYIEGPQGSGKSLSTLLAVQRLAWDDTWNVLWLHVSYYDRSDRMRGMNLLHMWFGETYGSDRFDEPNETDIEIIFETFLPVPHKKSMKQLLVLDGIRLGGDPVEEYLYKMARWWRYQPKSCVRRLIVISRNSLLSNPLIGRTEGIRAFRQFGWDIAEYEAALKNQKFRRSVSDRLQVPTDLMPAGIQSRALLRAKHFYAGSNVSFMFSMRAEDVVSAIDNAIRGLANCDSLNAVGRFGSELFGEHQDRRTEIISEYARRAMYGRISGDLIHETLMERTKNLTTSAEGFLFREWFFGKTNEPRFLSSVIDKEGLSWWRIPGYFWSDLAALSYDNCESGILYRPTDPDWPGFDGLILQKGEKPVVRFFRTTAVLSQNDADLECCKQITAKLDAECFEFYVIAPDETAHISMRGLQIRSLTVPGWIHSSRADFGSRTAISLCD